MSDQSLVPAPAPAPQAPKPEDQWQAPANDQEFVFESVDSAPGWIDRNWASFDRGPALALPAGDVYGAPPYTTKTARVGDKVVYTAAKGAQPAKFDVIRGDPIEGHPNKRPPQQSGAQLEDLLKQGYISPEELSPDAKAQVMHRSPELKAMLEGTIQPPEPQSLGDQIKVD